MMTEQDYGAKQMEKHLLETRFPLECKEIPLEALNRNEQIVVIKCMEGEDLTDEEFTLLKKTLQNYRKAIETYKPSETVEAFEKTRNIIQTEEDWLNLVDTTNLLLRVNVPFSGETYPMTFEVLPIDDSRIVQTMQSHVELFRDYKPSEIQLFTRAQNGEIMTPEEAAIVAKMTKDIENKASEDRIETMNHFLASQLKLENSNTSFEKRKEFWTKFPFMTKSAIMIKVEEMLGLTEQSNEKLFPDIK